MNAYIPIHKTRLEIDYKKLKDASYGITSLTRIALQNQIREETDGETFLNGSTYGGLLAAIELLGGIVSEIAEGLEEILEETQQNEGVPHDITR